MRDFYKYPRAETSFVYYLFITEIYMATQLTVQEKKNKYKTNTSCSNDNNFQTNQFLGSISI